MSLASFCQSRTVWTLSWSCLFEEGDKFYFCFLFHFFERKIIDLKSFVLFFNFHNLTSIYFVLHHLQGGKSLPPRNPSSTTASSRWSIKQTPTQATTTASPSPSRLPTTAIRRQAGARTRRWAASRRSRTRRSTMTGPAGTSQTQKTNSSTATQRWVSGCQCCILLIMCTCKYSCILSHTQRCHFSGNFLKSRNFR